MVQDWSGQDVGSIASEICGFITVLSGTVILHATREEEEQSTGPGEAPIYSTYLCYFSYNQHLIGPQFSEPVGNLRHKCLNITRCELFLPG